MAAHLAPPSANRRDLAPSWAESREAALLVRLVLLVVAALLVRLVLLVGAALVRLVLLVGATLVVPFAAQSGSPVVGSTLVPFAAQSGSPVTPAMNSQTPRPLQQMEPGTPRSGLPEESWSRRPVLATPVLQTPVLLLLHLQGGTGLCGPSTQ